MKRYDRKVIGVLGTVIIHLIAGIFFMSFQISSLKNDLSAEYEVELTHVDEPVTKNDKLIELPENTIERILKGDNEMLDIARNLANKSEEKINPADYIDKVKEELIKSGKLGVDNYIDAQKKAAGNKDNVNLLQENDSSKIRKNDKPQTSQQMAANYKGATRIYYDLTGRTHMYLPIPIYKCQGAGLVVLSIEVNQKGIVEKAQVVENESSTSDPCLIETAVTTAMISRFIPDVNSPKIQTGTLSYQFVAQ
jgi:hypothetical protein